MPRKLRALWALWVTGGIDGGHALRNEELADILREGYGSVRAAWAATPGTPL